MFRVVFIFLCLSSLLSAEIDQVNLSWDPVLCNGECLGMMQRNLNKFPPAATFIMDGKKGTASIRWKPNSTFDLQSVKRLYQSIGVGFGRGDLSIKVHGVITSDAKGYLIQSIGDNTKFRLIGADNTSPTAFQSSASWQSFPLTGAQKNQLSQARTEDLVTDISGAIYFNNFDYPMIQVQSIQFPNLLPNERSR